MADSDSKTLGELIWRSYKLKITVLVVGLTCMWMTSSRVTKAKQDIQTINKDSVDARLAFYKSHGVTLNSPGISDPNFAEMMDETELQLYSHLLSEVQWDDKSKGREIFEQRRRELEQLDRRRRDTYNIDLNIPYLKDTLLLNALLLMDLWPIIVIVTIAAVLAIGLRQRATEIIFSKSITDASQAGNTTSVAATGFLAGELQSRTISGSHVLVYTRPLILLPEPFITVCLLFALICISFNVPETETPSIFALRSTIFGLHTALLLILGVLILVISKTRAYYDKAISVAIGERVLTRMQYYLEVFGRVSGHFLKNQRISHVGIPVLCGVAIGSLLFPWIEPWRVYGYELLKRLPPVASGGEVVIYKIDPRIFSEMRIQLILALIFVLLVLARRLFSKTEAKRLLDTSAKWGSYLVILMTVNFSIFLGFMYYRQDREIANAVFSTVFGSSDTIIGSIKESRGLPLVLASPGYGFTVFMACIIILALLTLEAKSTKDSATAPKHRNQALKHGASA